MTDAKDSSELNKAWDYYEKIKKALDGLFEILTINFDENNIFYQCGLDNLKNLKDTIMDLLKHDYNPAEIKRKMRELEFDIKRSLFFEEDKQGTKTKEKPC